MGALEEGPPLLCPALPSPLLSVADFCRQSFLLLPVCSDQLIVAVKIRARQSSNLSRSLSSSSVSGSSLRSSQSSNLGSSLSSSGLSSSSLSSSSLSRSQSRSVSKSLSGGNSGNSTAAAAKAPGFSSSSKRGSSCHCSSGAADPQREREMEGINGTKLEQILMLRMPTRLTLKLFSGQPLEAHQHCFLRANFTPPSPFHPEGKLLKVPEGCVVHLFSASLLQIFMMVNVSIVECLFLQLGFASLRDKLQPPPPGRSS